MDRWGHAAIQILLLGCLDRLSIHVPLAGNEETVNKANALCAENPLVFDNVDDRPFGIPVPNDAKFAGLTQEGIDKFFAVIARGPEEVVRIVEEAIEDVVTNPLLHKNMCNPVAKTKRGEAPPPRTLRVDLLNLDHHTIVRYTVYSVLKSKFGYGGGERVPFPALAETIVKLCFPGQPDTAFTQFNPSEPRGIEGGEGEAGEQYR